jgi:hypothetical protein
MHRVARALMLAAVCLVLPAPGWAQTAEPQRVDISHLIPTRKPFFAGAADHWEATYQGKNRPAIVVSIIGLRDVNGDVLLLQTTLGSRADIPLSRNLAVKLLELSATWDFAKVVLYEKAIAIRLDHPIKGLDPIALERLCDAVATATDLALSEIKNFLP